MRQARRSSRPRPSATTAPADPASYSEVGTVTDDDSGLTVGIRKYGDPDTGLYSVSAELCYGLDVGAADALLRLV